MESHKIHVPNHQPVNSWLYVFIGWWNSTKETNEDSVDWLFKKSLQLAERSEHLLLLLFIFIYMCFIQLSWYVHCQNGFSLGFSFDFMACILLISNACCAPSLNVILFICFHCIFHIFSWGFRCSFVHFFSIWISVLLLCSFHFLFQLDFGFSHTFSCCQTCWLFFVFHVYVYAVRHVHFSFSCLEFCFLFIVSLF